MSYGPKCRFEDINITFIYFATIMKQVNQFILITLVCPDVCAHQVFVWKKTGEPRGNPRGREGDPIPFHSVL